MKKFSISISYTDNQYHFVIIDLSVNCPTGSFYVVHVDKDCKDIFLVLSMIDSKLKELTGGVYV